MVVGLGLGVSQRLHRQAPAGEDAAQAGLAASTGLALDLHTDLDVGSFPAAATGTNEGSLVSSGFKPIQILLSGKYTLI